MYNPLARPGIPFLIAVCLIAAPATTAAQEAPRQPPSDLDAFMEKVLARREQNRLTLQRYVLDETEEFSLLGPARMPLLRRSRDFTWYVRDGLHVRSPVRFDGVAVGDHERTAYEEAWARRERSRLEREKEERASSGKAEDPVPEPASAADPTGDSPIPMPRFVSEAYFLEFKFEPGNYYLAGREQLEGRDVLAIEYYPTRMFGDERDEERERERERGRRSREARIGGKAADPDRIERQMNKTALITLWVDAAEHQIVKYTFDNVWMDFLPGAWLVRVDEIRASMTMGQPFPGVWLPRQLELRAGATLANGSFRADYGRRFMEYRLAEVQTRIRVPDPLELPVREPAAEEGEDETRGPFARERQEGAAPVQPAGERVVEIRVHGNAFVADEEVIRLAGVTVGDTLDGRAVAVVEARLRRSGLFESVEVRKRFRSLADPSAVSLLLVVHEKPGVTSTAEGRTVSSPWRRLRSSLMFLPIVHYSDGYGFTYGARVSTVDLLGAGERLSVPSTWGGTRRVAFEVERTFERGPLTRAESSFGIWQRENPHFELDERRIEWRLRAERHFGRLVRTGVDTGTASVTFGDLDDRVWTIGADVAFDTRSDPAFPRNAVYAGAGWRGIDVRGPQARVNRYTADARGYLGLFGQTVLAARAQYTGADAPLPAYERLLVGGGSSLRGFRAGAFSGDRALLTSAELRVPLTSVLNGARLGAIGFVDAGRVHDVGTRLSDAPWRQSVGGGVFLIASILRLNLDVAHGLETGDTRVHLGMGFAF